MSAAVTRNPATRPSASITLREALAVGLLTIASTLVYLLLSGGREVPDVFADEVLYGELARSIAAGDGATWRGEGVLLHSVYPYVLAPSWWVSGSAPGAYEIARGFGALLACTVVVPVWLLSRAVVTGPRVWIAPAGAVAGAWMTFSGRLLAENIAYPLALWSLAAIVLALLANVETRAGRRWIAAALVFASLASAARIQLAVLFPVILAALAIGHLRARLLARRDRSRTTPRFGARIELLLAFAVPLLLAAAVAASPLGVLGRYRSVTGGDLDVANFAYWTANNFAELALMAGIAPLVALVMLAASRESWLDDRTAALLAVTLPACALLLTQVGWFAAGHAPVLIDRYVVYAVPLLLVSLAAAIERGGLRAAYGLITAGAIAICVWPLPSRDGVGAWSEALVGLRDLISGDLQLVAAVALLGVASAAAFARPVTSRRRLHVVTVAVVAALAVNSSVNAWQLAGERAETAAQLVPAERDWVDKTVTMPVGIVHIAPEVSEVAYINELMNNRVNRAFLLQGVRRVPGGEGGACAIAIEASGTLTVDRDRGCVLPRLMMLVGRDATLSVAGGRVLADHPEVPVSLVDAGTEPRARALVRAGCAEGMVCAKLAAIDVWPIAPARIAVTVASAEPATVEIGRRRVSIPAAGRRTVSTPLPPGHTAVTVNVLRTPAGNQPRVESVTLAEDGEPLRIFRRVRTARDHDRAP